MLVLVWLGLSELTLLPDRTDKSTGDSCCPKSGDQLSVESEELRLSETISGGGRKCSNRLNRGAKWPLMMDCGGDARLLLVAGVKTQEAGAAGVWATGCCDELPTVSFKSESDLARRRLGGSTSKELPTVEQWSAVAAAA